MVLATSIAAANGERAWIAAREKIAFVFRLPPRERSAPKSAILAPSIDKATPAAENGVAPAALAPLDAPKTAPNAPTATPNALSNATTGPTANVIAPVPELARLEARPVRTSAPAHRAATVPAKAEAQAQAPEAPAKADVSPIPVPSANPRPRDSAAILFDDANAARRRGNTVEAASLYRDLQARFPASAEARLSIAVVARMQLDAGETAAAASGFSAYLATGDRALREEAMAGRAMAFGRLGRSREEADAWRELLRAYPRSGYAGLAKTRMGQDPSR